MELVTEDRVWQAILTGIMGRSRKIANTGFINICCPMCVTLNETADKRHRCGIINSNSIGVSCFNCGFKAGFKHGHLLGRNMRAFLAAIGISNREINHIGFWAELIRLQISNDPTIDVPYIQTLDAPTVSLPRGAKSLEEWNDLGCHDAHYLDVIRYLLSRGDDAVTATTYFWSPSTWNNFHKRLIIPCYQDHRLVGWTARAVDSSIQPRYLKEIPSRYLFNAQVLSYPHSKYAFIVEGAFDALMLAGVGALGASLGERQIAYINQSGKQPVVVPDRDKAGHRLIEIAIQQNWPVAAPCYGRYQWWDADVKDAAQAIQRYGKLYTVQSILATLESDPNQIRLRASFVV